MNVFIVSHMSTCLIWCLNCYCDVHACANRFVHTVYMHQPFKDFVCNSYFCTWPVHSTPYNLSFFGCYSTPSKERVHFTYINWKVLIRPGCWNSTISLMLSQTSSVLWSILPPLLVTINMNPADLPCKLELGTSQSLCSNSYSVTVILVMIMVPVLTTCETEPWASIHRTCD